MMRPLHVSILQVRMWYKFSPPIVNTIALKLYTEPNHITGNYHWDNEKNLCWLLPDQYCLHQRDPFVFFIFYFSYVVSDKYHALKSAFQALITSHCLKSCSITLRITESNSPYLITLLSFPQRSSRYEGWFWIVNLYYVLHISWIA